MRRLRRHGAVLLLLRDRNDLAAYGWLQAWAPLRYEFWWLADDAICLGPYWTHPQQRGRGLYGRLLSHSVAECRRRFPRDLPIYIWAESSNAASIRGIEKAGFRSVGLHRVSIGAGGLIRRHESLSQPLDASG
jgi:L-amino acid N-acyltransferase YncA